jgi:TonB family protein
MMNDVLIYLWEGSFCLALTVGFYKVFFEKLTFFEWNRFMLLILLAASVLVPLFTIDVAPSMAVLPEVQLPVFWVGGQIEPESMVNSSDFSWQKILFSCYIVGVVFAASKFVWGTLRLWIQIKSATHQVYNGNKLAIHSRFEPASFFGYIMLPSFDPTDTDHQLILQHESVHCTQRHTLDLLLVQLLKVFFWFNPFIFMYERMIREVHEFQADHFITRFHSTIAYSKLLLRLVTKSNSNRLVHSFNQFQTKKRIMMMTQTNTNPIQKARFILALPLIGLFLAVFSCKNSKVTTADFPENLLIPMTAESTGDTTNVTILREKNGKKVLVLTEIEANAEEELFNQVMKNKEISSVQENGKKVLVVTATEPTGEEVFEITEIQPKPAGGMEGWMNYLAESLKYPEEAKERGIEGTVVMAFIVNSDGTISNIETLRGIGGGCDQEAMRVIQNAPKWTPGQLGGKAVRVRMRLPLRFILPKS